MDDNRPELHLHMSSKLVGQEGAERAFLDAYNDDKLQHAWLISGPKGVGKATLAYKVACFMLASSAEGTSAGASLFGDAISPDSLTVDDNNPVKQRIISGSHGDLMVINRSVNVKTGKLRNDIVVDDVRKLSKFYSQTASEGGWRVAIIDAADEMNINAANALLKNLEEPPEKALLLLVSHAPGRLLPTIRSRCRQLALKPLGDDAVVDILRSQYPALNDSDYKTLAALSGGAPGRALELAEGDGLGLYGRITSLMMTLPRLDIPALHQLADSLASIKADSDYRLFRALFQDIMQRLIRFSATGQVAPAALIAENQLFETLGPTRGVDQWLDLWEKMAEQFTSADAVNLDRKQILLTCFGKLAGRA